MKKITIFLILIGLFQLSYAQTSTFTYDANGNQIARVRPAVSYLVNVSKDTTVQKGTTLQLSATGGDSYLWSTGETTAAIIVQPDSTTRYAITVHCICGALIKDTVVVTVPKSVASHTAPTPLMEFKVFPNPVSNELRVKIELPQTERIRLVLLRATGEQLWTKQIDAAAAVQLSESVESYPSGVYLLQLHYQGTVTVRQFVIAR